MCQKHRLRLTSATRGSAARKSGGARKKNMSMQPENEVSRSVARFHEVMGAVDEITHVVLKGHLLIEETLTNAIALHIFHPEHFYDAKLSFDKKISLGRGFCLRKNHLGEWDMLVALNELRNVLAHNLNSPKQQAKIDRLRTLTLRETVEFPEVGEYLRSNADKEMIIYACGHILGFLERFENDAKQLRSIIHAMDRTMNPDQPEFTA
jgi:hypothetical protein